MQKIFFLQQVLDQLKGHLENGDIELVRIKQIALDALHVVDDSAQDVPNENVLDYLSKHPEVEGEFVVTMEHEDRQAREATVDELRKLINYQRS